MTESHRPVPILPPATAGELFGRLVMCFAFMALAYGLVTPLLLGSAARLSPELWVLPRLGTFALAAVVSGLLQGARPREWFLAVGALLALISVWFLSPSEALNPGVTKGHEGVDGRVMLRLQLVVFSAACLGTWFARFLDRPAHVLAVVLCAAAGDAWFSIMHVLDTIPVGHPLCLLRFPWPPAIGGVVAAPSFVDVLFMALYLEAARRLGFSVSAVFSGVTGGYIVASFLALATWHVTLSLPLMGLGVLMGAWPAFRCSAREVLKAFALALLLFCILLGLTVLRAYLHPAPSQGPDRFHLRNVARVESTGSFARLPGASGMRHQRLPVLY